LSNIDGYCGVVYGRYYTCFERSGIEQVSQSSLLPGKIKSQKLRYFGHVACHASLQNRITLGYMPGTRRQGGQRKPWLDYVTDWTGLKLPEVLTTAAERRRYGQFVHSVVQAPHGV